MDIYNNRVRVRVEKETNVCQMGGVGSFVEPISRIRSNVSIKEEKIIDDISVRFGMIKSYLFTFVRFRRRREEEQEEVNC